MRLLLDEQINPAVARELRKKGYAVAAVGEVRMRGASDHRLLAFAADEKRILVTYNIRDFHQLLIEWHLAAKRHFGIIFVSERSIPQRRIGPLVRALTRLLQATAPPGGLENQAVYLFANIRRESS